MTARTRTLVTISTASLVLVLGLAAPAVAQTVGDPYSGGTVNLPTAGGGTIDQPATGEIVSPPAGGGGSVNLPTGGTVELPAVGGTGLLPAAGGGTQLVTPIEGGAGGATATTPRTLPFTGAELAALLGLGAGAVAGGIALMAAGRRRSVATA